MCQRAIKLVKNIYEIVEQFPKKETYALSDQVRGSSVSIQSNIAEGFTRSSTKEFINFLYIALGSASELETQRIIVKEVSYMDNITNLIDDLAVIKR